MLQLRAVQSLRVEAAKRRAGVQGLRARSRAPETVPVPAEAEGRGRVLLVLGVMTLRAVRGIHKIGLGLT